MLEKNAQERNEVPVVIREASPEDSSEMREVLYKTWLDTYPNEEAGITRDDIEDFNARRNSPEEIRQREESLKTKKENELRLVSEVDGKIVGLATFVRHGVKNQLQAIYVLPEVQGMGVGKKLWAEGSKFFDPTKETIVNVATYNDQAINFYKKLGFEDTGIRFAEERFKMKSGAVIPEMTMIIKAKK